MRSVRDDTDGAPSANGPALPGNESGTPAPHDHVDRIQHGRSFIGGPHMSQAQTSLYERLGRREGIERITRSVLKNHLANPLIRTRYENSKDLAQVERRVVEFFCAGAGGPETYTGKDMRATHRGMNVSEQEFVTVIDDVLAALEENGVDPPTRNEVLAILWSLKNEVIRV
jgi:hemoglobin